MLLSISPWMHSYFSLNLEICIILIEIWNKVSQLAGFKQEKYSFMVLQEGGLMWRWSRAGREIEWRGRSCDFGSLMGRWGSWTEKLPKWSWIPNKKFWKYFKKIPSTTGKLITASYISPKWISGFFYFEKLLQGAILCFSVVILGPISVYLAVFTKCWPGPCYTSAPSQAVVSINVVYG